MGLTNFAGLKPISKKFGHIFMGKVRCSIYERERQRERQTETERDRNEIKREIRERERKKRLFKTKKLAVLVFKLTLVFSNTDN